METMPFIVAIVAIIGGLFYSAYEQKMKLKMKEAQHKNTGVDLQTQEELKKLKERVAVLEKIVTDKNYALKDEIDSLERVG